MHSFINMTTSFIGPHTDIFAAVYDYSDVVLKLKPDISGMKTNKEDIYVYI